MAKVAEGTLQDGTAQEAAFGKARLEDMHKHTGIKGYAALPASG